MIELKTETAKRLADLLETTMASHGIFDDWDEVVDSLLKDEDNGVQAVHDFTTMVEDAVELINMFRDADDKIDYDFRGKAEEMIEFRD